jgi:hypothetical protein
MTATRVRHYPKRKMYSKEALGAVGAMATGCSAGDQIIGTYFALMLGNQ